MKTTAPPPSQPKKRRLRSDSNAAHVNAVRAAAIIDLNPPNASQLRPGDRIYWEAIMAARSPVEWTTYDKMLAARLARTMTDIETTRALLDREGVIIDGLEGPKAHPAVKILDTQTRSMLALSRHLQLHGFARHGERREVEHLREAARKGGEVIDFARGTNGLIPFPGDKK